jgi:hypothetical protein
VPNLSITIRHLFRRRIAGGGGGGARGGGGGGGGGARSTKGTTRGAGTRSTVTGGGGGGGGTRAGSSSAHSRRTSNAYRLETVHGTPPRVRSYGRRDHHGRGKLQPSSSIPRLFTWGPLSLNYTGRTLYGYVLMLHGQCQPWRSLYKCKIEPGLLTPAKFSQG